MPIISKANIVYMALGNQWQQTRIIVKKSGVECIRLQKKKKKFRFIYNFTFSRYS